MAPSKSFRTYSRGNNSSINCIEAINILFAKNLTERKLHGKIKKGKNKIQIKELPKKITTHVKSVLSDESSLHVHVNDTFDKVFKGVQKSVKNISVKVTANKTSTSVIKHFHTSNHFSPMICKLRSYQSKSQNSNKTDSLSWFKHPTLPGERITNELEIEKMSMTDGRVKENTKKVSRRNCSRESPILLRSRVLPPEIVVTDASSIKKDMDKSKIPNDSSESNKKDNESIFQYSNLSFNPIFTNSVRERILVHSSTPLVSNKTKWLVKQPISPIKTVDDEIQNCINESLEEIKNWETSFPNIKPGNSQSGSLGAIEELRGFEKQDNVGQTQVDVKRDNFVTVRSRPINRMILESEKKRIGTDKTKTFNLEDFELFFNKFKSKSFKLEDFEEFHNSMMAKSFNQEDIKKFTSSLNQSQVNHLNSISLKDFESFYTACQNKISMSESSFLEKSHRSINYVTNRKHMLSLSKKSVNLSKKYLKLSKKFDLKNLVVVLDNILVNNSKAKLKRSKSLCQTAVMNSIIRKQPVVNLTRLSTNSLKARKPTFKAKDRVSLNNFRACRKFSSNWTPRRVTKSVSQDRLSSSDLSSIDNLTSAGLFCLGQLFINITRMPVQFGKSSPKVTEIKDDIAVDKRKGRNSEKELKIVRRSNKSNEKGVKSDDNLSEKENKQSENRKSLNKSQENKKSYTKRKESLSSSRETRMSQSADTKRKSKSVDFHEIHSDEEKTSIQLFLHSEPLEKASNKKSSGEKDYIARILVGSVSDTELELRDSNYPILRQISKSLSKYSQENIPSNSRSPSDIFKSPEKRISSRILRSRSNTSLNSFHTPRKTASYIHSPSPEDLTREVNSRLPKMSQSENNLAYTVQDLSSSILLNEEDDPVSPDNHNIRDVVVNLTLQSWDKSRESSHNTLGNGELASFASGSRDVKNSSTNKTKYKKGQNVSLSLSNVGISTRETPKREETTSQLPNSTKKSLRFTIQNSPIETSSSKTRESDLIESSLLNTSAGDHFKAPMRFDKLKQKVLNLKAGKSWRRSLLVHRRESFIDLTQDLESGNSYLTKATRHNSVMLQNTSVRRQSIRIVPVCDPRLSRRKTVLETYAHTNLSIVLDDSDTDVSLTPSKSKLSLEKSLPLVTAKDIVLKRCGQTKPQPFEKLYPESLLKDCKKIGEGVYGEVFLYSNPSGDTTVMKVIPIEGDKIVNGERQKKFDEILSEIVIALELSKLRKGSSNQTNAFSEVQRICCVKGKYPKTLLDLWEEYDNAKGSENDHPGIFEDDQLYIVLDLANGGRDLEAFVFNNALQAVSMFKQVACALAIAEQHLQFEHRDLHWGNVLLKPVEKNKKLICKHKEKLIENKSQGVEVTIIDFTLSRVVHDGVVIFNDLGQDPDLFVAQGDYQFDIYRLMKEKNSNNWQKFEPYSNVLWLHYILKKSITALRYKNAKTKLHKKNIECLKEYEKVILTVKSVSDFVSEYF